MLLSGVALKYKINWGLSKKGDTYIDFVAHSFKSLYKFGGGFGSFRKLLEVVGQFSLQQKIV